MRAIQVLAICAIATIRNVKLFTLREPARTLALAILLSAGIIGEPEIIWGVHGHVTQLSRL